jgi:DNA-binding NarL/FixJ family response regulator/anti-sigma regulatory factor (Ser/Thr protein kinase)
VLLADANPQTRAEFERFFAGLGWHCEVAANEKAVLDSVAAGRFDIVVTDVEMPQFGIGLLSEILKLRPAQPIVAVASTATTAEAIRCFRLGAADMVPRPIDFGWLNRSLSQLLQGARDEDRQKLFYRAVTNERSSFQTTSRELAGMLPISLPIIQRLGDAGVLDANTVLRLRLAVLEAVVNALEHGNLELESKWKDETLPSGDDRFSATRRERLVDPRYADRRVGIVTEYTNNKLIITIADQGAGFLNNLSIGRSADEDAEACYGRGLALISGVVDEVHFDNNGSKVTLVKIIGGEKNGA